MCVELFVAFPYVFKVCSDIPCLIPELETSPGGGHGDPLQCSCLENPMDRGAWRATVHGVSKSRTQLKQLSTHVRP